MHHDWKWDLIPATLGAASLALVAGAVWSDNIEKYVFNYQTLITGFVAIFAAWWTVRHTRQQLAHQREELEFQKQTLESNRKRREAAAAAQLPRAFRELEVYARDYIVELQEIVRNAGYDDEDFVTIVLDDLPSLPQTASTILTSYIEAAGDERSEAIVALIPLLENLNAAKQTYGGKTSVGYDAAWSKLILPMKLAEAIEASVRIQGLLSVTMKTGVWLANPPTVDNMISEITNFQFQEQEHPELYAYVRRIYDSR